VHGVEEVRLADASHRTKVSIAASIGNRVPQARGQAL
jgi:hypothetical protein